MAFPNGVDFWSLITLLLISLAGTMVLLEDLMGASSLLCVQRSLVLRDGSLGGS